jgi:hypothetical protein
VRISAKSRSTNMRRHWLATPGRVLLPLVLFEDRDVMQLRIARLRCVHLLNTAAWLLTLYREGLLPEGLELLGLINTSRATTMILFEKVGLTKRVRSSWLRRSFGR